MCLGCIICTDEARLVLSCRVLRLAERETTVPPHTLYGTNFLDGILEPIKRYDELVAKAKNFSKRVLGLSWPIIRDVILLNFLCDVIRFRRIRPLIAVVPSAL